jgi:hypothetical protein
MRLAGFVVTSLLAAILICGCSGGGVSDAEFRENCKTLREAHWGNSACTDLEEREFEEGWAQAEADEEAERRSSPSGESKWEELGH